MIRSASGGILVDTMDLQKALALHEAYLNVMPNGKRLVMVGADLRKADLCGANLSDADFSGADLRGADLHGANLRRANLSSADLTEANFSKAILSGANLSDACLKCAYLYKAYLFGTALCKTNLTEANLSETNLFKANLFKAYLSGADLSGASLLMADLSGADLSGANLFDAVLSGADLRGAILPFNPPVVENIYSKILDAIGEDAEQLYQPSWHCDTAHCMGGWATILAGEKGRQLEKMLVTSAAAALIFAASDPLNPVPDFYANKGEALEILKARAATEQGSMK